MSFNASAESLSRLELESSETDPPPPFPYSLIQSWKSDCQTPQSSDSFIGSLPKVELHVHVGGTLSSSLCFQLAKKHGLQPIKSERLKKQYWDESSLEWDIYGGLLGVRSVKGKGISAFFEAYYGMIIPV